MAARRVARHPRPVRPRGEARAGEPGPGDGDLPAVPPVGLRAQPRVRGPGGGSRPQLPGAALGRVGQVEHDRVAGAPALDAARRARHEGVRQGCRDHRPGGARPTAPGHHLPVRARLRRRGAGRQELAAAGRGPHRRAGADHHHNAAEVPVRDAARQRAARPALRGGRRRGPLVTERRGGQRAPPSARRRRVEGRRRPERDPARRGGAGPGRRGRSPRPAGQPQLVRVHGHAQGQDARAVRPPRRRHEEASAVPPLLDAAGDRGALHPRRARQLHDLRDLLRTSKRRSPTTRPTRRPRRAGRSHVS